jgi:predicted DsbA family dithiol-disulfide isomerase
VQAGLDKGEVQKILADPAMFRKEVENEKKSFGRGVRWAGSLPREEVAREEQGKRAREEVARAGAGGVMWWLGCACDAGRGVPFFIVNGEEALSGAQPPETFEEIFGEMLKA